MLKMTGFRNMWFIFKAQFKYIKIHTRKQQRHRGFYSALLRYWGLLDKTSEIMKITIAPEILKAYPGTHIGWLYAHVIVEAKNDYVEALKSELPRILQEYGLSKTEELSKHPRIANWRKIYSAMGVKPSSYRCSLEALLRRVIKGENIWNVSSVVDCYNCVSVMTLLPMELMMPTNLKETSP